LEVVMRIPKPVLGGFLVLILLAAGAYLVFFNKAPAAPGVQAAGASAASDAGQAADQQAGQKPAAAPLPVKAVKAKKADLVITLKSPGEAYTREQIVLKAEVGGVVKNLYAAEGRHVKGGDLLVELDDRGYRLELERREAVRLQKLSDLFLERQFASACRHRTAQQSRGRVRQGDVCLPERTDHAGRL
jgi:multidrug efflux pump subunit AcrA (membrane-fusion protein)